MLSEIIIAEGGGEPALFSFVPLFPASLCCSAIPCYPPSRELCLSSLFL